ncbi:MAG TPA: hypothetical protein VGK61_07180 [Planctomycetota bacterium]|jgi:hypothetical protein
MNSFSPLLAALLIAGCAAAPEQDAEPVKDVIKDPAKIHGFFLRKIRDREEAIAAKVTTLKEEELVIGIRNRIAPDLTRRIILGFQQHSIRVAEDGKTAVARWCNPEFGITWDIDIVRNPKLPIWQLHITREEIEELAPAGLAWFRRQREAADGRIYAYPPDWTPAPVMTSCPCGR